MIGVFNIYPWIMPAESEDVRSFFLNHGIRKNYAKRQLVPHGGENGMVALVTRGFLSFYFFDRQARQQVFSLIPEDRLLGDIEALDGSSSYAVAECFTETELFTVPRRDFTEYLRSSVGRMENYAISANRKHQCMMEGMMAAYIYPVPDRLLLFLYSLICSFEPEYYGEYLALPLQPPLTDIAKVLSADRSWVSQTMSAWAKEGLVKRAGRSVYIHPALFDCPTIAEHFGGAPFL